MHFHFIVVSVKCAKRISSPSLLNEEEKNKEIEPNFEGLYLMVVLANLTKFSMWGGEGGGHV